ncbi:MAG: glycosyltransferase family 2 protein, partial [Acidobacteriota bacterium]
SLLRLARRARPAPPPPAELTADLPRVTVQLPVFNERYVVGRLIRAACALEWPRQRLQIQILDDSTDETREIAARMTSHYRSLGLHVEHLHRRDRRGYKAGALEAGLRRAEGEFVAVFDADFVPPPDFLRRMMPSFRDPDVGMVQARWGHLNRDYSPLTRIEALFLDGHFQIEHRARYRAGLLFNFNGTAGVWRRSCLEEAGGWEADTLTEDLDLSYRAQLRGWRFVYREDVVAPAEIPVEVAAFKSQQHRWAKGSIQTARKLAGRILRAPLRPRQKTEALLHLGNNTAYLLLLLLGILLVASLPARQDRLWPTVLETPLFLLGTGSVCAFFLEAQRGTGTRGWGRWLALSAAMALGLGLAVNNGRAVVEALVGSTGEFRRTPKHAVRGRRRRGDGYRLPWDPVLAVEVALAGYFLGAILWTVRHGIVTALPFLCLFAAGYLFLSLGQLGHGMRGAARGLRARPRHLRS